MPQRSRSKLTFATTDVVMLRRPAGLAAVATALIVAVGAAGCGSSGSDSTSTAAISKSEFLAKANAICTAGNKETDAAAEKAFGNQQPTQAELEAFAKTAIPSIQRQIDEIRALGAPSGDEATVKQMFDVAQADVDKVKSDPGALASGDPFADFSKLAHPYGLDACASDN